VIGLQYNVYIKTQVRGAQEKAEYRKGKGQIWALYMGANSLRAVAMRSLATLL